MGRASRYFLALWPPDAVRAGIQSVSRRWLSGMRGPCRLTASHRYHLTLVYIGPVPTRAASSLALVREHARHLRAPAFSLHLDCLGHFGRGVGWLGCRDTPGPMLALQADLEADCRQLGLVDSTSRDAFIPHVTLARDASRYWPDAPGHDVAVHWYVEEFALIESQPEAGYAYRVIERFRLTEG